MKMSTGGLGGSGGVGGRSASTSAGRMLSRLKAGIADSKLDYLRGGMRDLTAHRAAYAGKTKREVEAIATGRMRTNEGRKFAPIRIEIERGKYYLTDGRHRMTAAREAGARHILADITIVGSRNGIQARRRTIIRIPKK